MINESMQFVYQFAKLPNQEKIINDINSSATKLYSKLSSTDFSSIPLSDYMKNYLELKMKDLLRNLQLACYILSWSLASMNKSYKDFHFIEYGGGSGLTCLLAKELGLTVTYNDIYDISVNDATRIAKTVDNPADHYIQGDISDLHDFLLLNKINCDAIASNDVIEHIYNIKDFFYKLQLLPSDSMSVVMTSGANPYHPYIRRKLMKKHIELETKNRKKVYGHKDRDTLKAYKYVREELISEYLKKSGVDITKTELEKLSGATRGMSKEDIFEAVGRYLNTKEFPVSINHPTNTCDPYTGNWAEHLMNPYDLANMLREQRFDSMVIAGFYGDSYRPVQRFVGKTLDCLIYTNLLGAQSLKLSPFYTIYGRRESGTTK